ncbi:TPA: BppU family phage baseplate upper protein [Enterococcus faecium]|uniref:BppU family phage baseplate upper protein n=2 Tax=Enterococcus faecium TaxID=1352 RepID=UPI0016502764|nr:BppU family phage baseplate upper protein [Enterococcus faecium]EKZ0498226.1 BppU family phage baseplate upper protein [Enterococcus faecium]MBT1015707.1 BppU family phage baseplate upper protein [Enterococcus faecium]MBT1019370.1 BppU family phage baseplate upper protein [Enterococcus faecium]MBT1042752.1 BppU family phage baseplate upper protein [Enterococcus faecium]MCH3574101.1 BppU family phage baseplate upper protein [Enterococcus faecium]
MAFKINESIIVIQAEATSPNRTNVVFWSHDRGTAKLRMKLVRKNGIPQSLPEGTTVPIRLMFRSATAEGGYGKHDYLATIEDRVNGIVSIVLEDNILGYVGIVEGSVYIDFPNDRSLDTAGRFTFDIKRSPIDDSTPELEDYYFNGFSQTIDKIEKILADGKQEIEQKITESETQIDAKLKNTNDKITKANQDVTTLNTNIDKANDRIDQTNQQISDLGKLKKMYSNSIDFGNYDYSGNPNLLSKLSYDLIENQNTSAGTLSKGENSFKYNKISAEVEGGVELYYKRRGIANWLPSNKTLVMTVKLRAGADYSPVDGKLILIRYRYVDSGTGKIVLDLPINSNSITQEWKEFSITGTTPTFSPQAYHPWIQFRAQDGILGEIEMSYDIKIEEGSTATPFQPNLLAEPYNMCREYPNENIADHTVKFPIESGDHQIYQGYTEEELMIGQTYTITLKGTKPASQTFVAYNHWTARLGELKPVDGLTDVWSLTFTPTNVVAMPKLFRVYQYPRSTVGACQIDWLKIEKGNTRTPNISQFKYFGEGLKDSNNPNDYSWDITPEYAEKGLNNTVSLTEPETVLGLKNFKDGVQIDGVDVATVKNLGSVLQSGSGLTTIQSDKQSAFDEFSYEFERIGDRVFFHARVKTNSTTAVASHVNLLEIPLGFQFPIGWTIVGVPLSVVQWTTPQGEISALVITDSTGKQVVKFATNRVGNHYISGEWRTADSYPETK